MEESRQNSSKALPIIITIIIIIIAASAIIVFTGVFKKNNATKDNKEELPVLYVIEGGANGSGYWSTDYKVIDDKHVQEKINSTDKVLGKYQCKTNKCGTDSGMGGLHYPFVGQNKVILVDGEEENELIYNYETDEIEKTNAIAIRNYDLSENDYVIVWKKNNKYALMNKDGEFITEYIYDELSMNKLVVFLGYYENNFLYYGKMNYVRANTNNKWGIIDAKTGKTIIDYKYDNILFALDKENTYIIKENNKWYLIDKTGQKLFSTGYDGIIPFSFGALVIEKGEDTSDWSRNYKIKLIDYVGKDLTDYNTIEMATSVLDFYFEKGVLEATSAGNKITLRADVDSYELEYDLSKGIVKK